MPSSSSASPPQPLRSRWRRPAIVFLLIVAIAGLGISLLPEGLRLLAVHVLADDGKRTASMADLRINPFTGLVVVEGLSVIEPDGRGIHIGKLNVDLSMTALVKRRLHFHRLRVEEASFDLVREGSSLKLAGLPAPGEPAATKPEEETWQAGIDRLVLRGIKITIHDLKNSQSITLDRADVARLAMWDPERESDLSISATLPKGTLALSGRARPLGGTPGFDGKLTLKNVDVARVTRLANPEAASVVEGEISAILELMIEGGSASAVGVTAKGDISAGSLTIDGKTRLSALSLRKMEAEYRIKGGETVANLTGIASIERLATTAGDVAVSIDGLRWDGRIDHTARAAGDGKLALTGMLTQGQTVIDLEQGTRLAYQGLDATGLTLSATRNTAGAATARLGGQIALTRITAATPDMTVSDARLAWKGEIGVTLSADQQVGFDAEGHLDATDAQISLPGQGLDARQGSFRWSGKVALDTSTGRRLAHTGDLSIKNVAIESADPAVTVLAADDLSVDRLVADGSGTWAADRAAINGIRSLAVSAKTPQKAPVRLDGIAAQKITYDGLSRVVAEAVNVTGFNAELVREKDGKFRLVGSLLALAAKASPPADSVADSVADPAEETGPAAAPVTFAVGAWTLGKGSRLGFIDKTVDPAVSLAVEGLTARLTGIDSARLDADVPIEITSKIGKFASLKATGGMRPFSAALFLDLTGRVNGFDLASVSPYARDLLGYEFARGRLDVAFKTAIKEGKLEGQNKLTISKLQVSPGKTDKARKAAEGLPLETALSLLKDSKDVISLELPVTGDIASPNFDFGDVVGQAVGGALKKAVLGTLSLIFPVGGVIEAISASGLPERLGLKPVPFKAGSADLTGASKQFLGQVGKMLRERPGVKLTLCGIATAQDRDTLVRQLQKEAAKSAAAKVTAPPRGKEAAPFRPGATVISIQPAVLLALAKKRGDGVKSWLIQNHGVAEARLFLCAPKIGGKTGSPRVDITL
jgi:hypothetical protein